MCLSKVIINCFQFSPLILQYFLGLTKHCVLMNVHEALNHFLNVNRLYIFHHLDFIKKNFLTIIAVVNLTWFQTLILYVSRYQVRSIRLSVKNWQLLRFRFFKSHWKCFLYTFDDRSEELIASGRSIMKKSYLLTFFATFIQRFLGESHKSRLFSRTKC